MTFTQVTTTCPYCSTGCSLNLMVEDGKVIGTAPYYRSPVNEGRVCPKGTYCHQFIGNPDRLKKPLIRKGDIFYEADWEAALNLIAKQFSSYKPEELAVLTSARCSNEDNYLAMKFARGVLKTRHIDHCARLCHSATMVGLNLAFGCNAMTNSIPDISESDCILCLGSNTLEQHPLVGRQIIKARSRGAHVISADPRFTPTAVQSDLFIQFYSGSDVLLLNSIMGEIIRNGWHDQSFISERTNQFEAVKKVVLQRRYEPEIAGGLCGVTPDLIRKTAEWIGTAKKCTILYAMGITQQTTGVDNVKSIANLMMLTGNIGRPGTGVNALRGQNNVQGACDAGCLPNFFPGYSAITDGTAHRRISKLWGFPDGICEPREGYDINTMFEQLRSSSPHIRSMYLIGENPVVSEPNPTIIIDGLKKVDFLVVQDIFFTETCQYADVVLPAACWAEKDGTQTNTERRVQRIRKAVDPPGEAKPDYEIITALARKMGYVEQFDYNDAKEIFEEMCSAIPQYRGMTWENVSRPEGIHWPCTESAMLGTQILYTDHFAHPDGKGVFFPVEWKEPADLPDKKFPFRLTTGRLIWHWQSGTMTRRCKNLNDEVNEGYLEMNPEDAKILKISSNDLIKVTFRKGSLVCKVRVLWDIKKGTAFIPLHFIERVSANVELNSSEPLPYMSEYKVAAISIKKYQEEKE
nr:formate dehydrogenase subunit alpha [uncultured Methanospirillum sp.]